MTHRLHVILSGRVQGVGFRYTTSNQARSLGLAGWVRNLSDGRVEAVFEGDRANLEKMLAWCQQGTAMAQVRDVDTHWEEGKPQHTQFRVVH
ncbi:MAG: acylphosphatase [Candidatus Hydrogenedentota bacterium]